MINHWMITGDCHGSFTRFRNYSDEIKNDPQSAVIILGDAGLNWTLNEYDIGVKNFLTKKYKFRIYCVRGNHEARPVKVKDMKLIYDEDVQGEVYIQEKWPQIRYFKDWGVYTIDGFKVAIIGGAYSVDKWYRLDNGYTWYEDEQLNEEEMIECTKDLTNQKVDFVFTHTCPICWEPKDLFLTKIDQARVDKTMELFLEEIAQCFEWNIWLFGHYHADRIERPGVEQFYKNTDDLRAIWDRWQKYWKDKSHQLDWWLIKSPNFYMEDILLEDREEWLYNNDQTN